MAMAEAREDAGTTECSHSGQAVANGFGLVFDIFAMCIALVCFLRAFGKRLCSLAPTQKSCAN